MKKKPKTSLFNVQVNRDVYVVGTVEQEQTIAKILEPLNFIRTQNHKSLKTSSSELFYIVAWIDFREKAQLAYVSKLFNSLDKPNIQKILYLFHPEAITQKQLLFSAEIGADYAASGYEKEQDLRQYVKRITVQSEQIGSITHFENEVARLIKKQDFKGLAAMDQRLGEMDKDSEAVLKLRATLNYRLGKHDKFEFYVKKVLAVNPQNLWAANELGKHYLRRRRPREGIAMLEKLSRFHELNAERHLTLGQAYLNVGDHNNAQATFEKGQQLDPSDERFDEGLAKAKILSGDSAGALDLLSSGSFPESVISFLNMRAIMAIKTGQPQMAFELYEQAIKHAPDDHVLKAKLHYNLGLGYVRHDTPEKAHAAFERSVEIGGADFKRAASPLSVTRKIIEAKGDQQDPIEQLSDDFGFEEFDDSLEALEKRMGVKTKVS